MDETLDTLKAQAPIVDSYHKLSKQINLSFQRVFEKIDDLKLDVLLASEAGPSNAKGGERMFHWKPSTIFQLRDESTNEDELMVTREIK